MRPHRPVHPQKTKYFCLRLLRSLLLHLPQVDGVSLQGCSEQRAMEVLRRTGPLIRLRLLRKAVRLSHILPPVPPLQPLRHSHSFHEGNPYRVGLNKIQETGALCWERGMYWLSGSMRGLVLKELGKWRICNLAECTKINFIRIMQAIIQIPPASVRHIFVLLWASCMLSSLKCSLGICTQHYLFFCLYVWSDPGVCAQMCFLVSPRNLLSARNLPACSIRQQTTPTWFQKR